MKLKFATFFKIRKTGLAACYFLIIFVCLSCNFNEEKAELTKSQKQQIIVNQKTQKKGYIIKNSTENEFLSASKMYRNLFIKDTLKTNKIDGILTLPLKNKVIKLKDFPIAQYESEGLEYKLVGEILSPNKYVVEVSYWEGKDYLLINKANGNVDTIWSIPYISPDNKRILTISPQWGMEGVPNGVKIFLNKESLIEEYKIIQDMWVPREVAWKNNFTVIIKMTPVTKYFDSVGSPSNYFEYIEIVFKPS
ncbi:MAG: hypothetical protein J7604_25650 [Sporocytophaga sp.]|uniref:hypothetical protein n=1 Tax=Sporocytophaga sp. TaxID=2231183 RepID=UPI001B20A0F1|nr:hypothetical protein [Sporocytophaga sp.]MBO9703615.1 hypothetical protein [Sporocytophaga sp.]